MEKSPSELVERIRLMLGTREAAPVARAAGIPVSTMQSIMHGTIPRADNAVKLAQVLGCTVEWLITGDGNPTPESAEEPAPISVQSQPQTPYGGVRQPTQDEIRAALSPYRRAVATLDEAVTDSGVVPNEALRQVLLSLLFRHPIQPEDVAQLLQAARPEEWL